MKMYRERPSIYRWFGWSVQLSLSLRETPPLSVSIARAAPAATMRDEFSPEKRRGRAGMTLLEIMIASALMLLFVGVALAVLTQTARTLDQVQVRTEAAALAWSRLERARHIDYTALDTLVEPTPGIRINALGQPDEGGRFIRNTTLAEVAGALPMQHVRVSVQVLDRDGTTVRGEPEIMETIITQVEGAGL